MQNEIKIYAQNISGAGSQVHNFNDFILEGALKHNADIIMFSEYAYPDNHSDVVKNFEKFQYKVATSTYKGNKYENGILFAIRESEHIKILDTFEGLNSNTLAVPNNLCVKLEYLGNIIEIIGIRIRVYGQGSKKLKLKSEQAQVISDYVASRTTPTIVIGDTNYKSSYLKKGHLAAASKNVNGKDEVTEWRTVNWENCEFVVPCGDTYQWKKGGKVCSVDCDLAIVKGLKAHAEPYNWDFEKLHPYYSTRERYEYINIGKYFPDHPAVILNVELN
ncbi:hypothetical protein NHG34_05135 [Aerococcaceae bacterium NML190938]|nr:hypothetical protein [Aerococcaceae bacterium NML191219]MCW6666931.1 hypothetical protein [Aerococcaceae bacterium NML190938]